MRPLQLVKKGRSKTPHIITPDWSSSLSSPFFLYLFFFFLKIQTHSRSVGDFCAKIEGGKRTNAEARCRKPQSDMPLNAPQAAVSPATLFDHNHHLSGL